MDLTVEFLSFFVIQSNSDQENTLKQFKHFQTMEQEEYEYSALKKFLHDEFKKIVKRKVDRHPGTANAPTKVGRFVVEPGYELDSNPNHNLFQRLRDATDKERFAGIADELVRIYMDTSAVRGGAFIIATLKWNDIMDESLLFLLKCDFEPKIATISDEHSLISEVSMAISARGIKSIQYPYIPEDGMIERYEVKIHQASHAKYFEDFLRYVSYEKPMPEIIGEQVVEMVHQFINDQYESETSTERSQVENELETWAASDKRELQQWWSQEQVETAAAVLVEQKENLPLTFKMGNITVSGLLSDFGKNIHVAEQNGQYVAIIQADAVQFEKGISPIELLKPQTLDEILPNIAQPSQPESLIPDEGNN
ncbi:DUF3900 domain-containing protein [Paenibacillus yanchengensis]|uniref:DUF3900 domain-containing protein n=1 Tax=Paenibacillus yanchengensis TaxID=2035833 RepID=A0ABW4YM19_9BACL